MKLCCARVVQRTLGERPYTELNTKVFVKKSFMRERLVGNRKVHTDVVTSGCASLVAARIFRQGTSKHHKSSCYNTTTPSLLRIHKKATSRNNTSVIRRHERISFFRRRNEGSVS